jgi:hypothetical protein
MPPKSEWGVLLLRGEDKGDFSILGFRKRDVTIVPCGVKFMSPKSEWGVLLVRGQDKANFYFLLKGQRFPRGQEKVTLLLCATQTLRGRLLFSRRAKERSPKKELGQQSLGAIDIHYELLGAIDIHYPEGFA